MDAPVGAPSNGLTYRQHLILGVSITTMGLAMISYALRLYAKRITAAKVWWDDYVIGIGLVRRIFEDIEADNGTVNSCELTP